MNRPAEKNGHQFTLRQLTLDRLRGDIVSGRLAPGLTVRDVDLAEKYKVSTSPLREALVALEAQGLVLKASARVRQIAPLNKSKALEIVEVVALLMEGAVPDGLQKVNPNAIRKLQALGEFIASAEETGDAQRALKGSRQFYDIILQAHGNDTLRQVIAHHGGWLERLFTLAIPVMKAGIGQYCSDLAQCAIEHDATKARDIQKNQDLKIVNLINDAHWIY